MKVYLFVLFIWGFYAKGYSQSIDLSLWHKSITTCTQIKNGTYEMSYKTKYLMSSDTVFKNLDCVFKRDSVDTIFGFNFDVERTIKGISDYYSYDDNRFIAGSKEHVKLFQSKEALNELISLQHNYDFFTPLNDFRNSEMSDLDIHLLQFVGKEKVGSNVTSHYRFIPLKDTSDVQILDSELNFWINEKDAVPVRYSVYYKVDLSGDTLEQYDEFNLISYSLDNQENHQFKTLDFFLKNSINVSEYVVNGNESPEKLLVGSKVPDWEFITNKKINYASTDQSYRLVLFDFYYQGCYPCLKAIPFLNKLNKMYDLKGRGLLVVGINNIDPVDERFYDFVKKKQIQYSVAVSPNKLNAEFKVSGYPTIFLMDNKGKLIYSSEGYGEQLEVELERIITEHLKQEGLLK